MAAMYWTVNRIELQLDMRHWAVIEMRIAKIIPFQLPRWPTSWNSSNHISQTMSDWDKTWLEALWWHGDSALIKLFSSNIQDGSHGSNLETLQTTSDSEIDIAVRRGFFPNCFRCWRSAFRNYDIQILLHTLVAWCRGVQKYRYTGILRYFFGMVCTVVHLAVPRYSDDSIFSNSLL